MRIFLSVLISACLSSTAMAHDFWVNPAPFTMEAPGKTAVSIRIGHAQDMSYWPINPDRIVSFRRYDDKGITDLQSLVLQGQKIVPMNVANEGFQILAIETTHAASVLPADQFSDYVEEEGLTPIHEARKIANTLNTPGREIYSRRGKALIMTGDLPKTDPDFMFKPLGMTLEVTPLNNPHRVESGETMKFQVHYRGQPLEGAQVMLVSLDTIAGDIASATSGKDGTITFKRPAAGDWMVHTVWSDPIDGHPLGDFDTTFSSLSFGYR